VGRGGAHGGDHTESPALDWTFLKEGRVKRFSVSITSSERCDYDGMQRILSNIEFIITTT